MSESDQIRLQVRIWQLQPNAQGKCLIQEGPWQIWVDHCLQYHLGEPIEIIGSLSLSGDKAFSIQKRLNVQSIVLKKPSIDSGLDTLSTLGYFLEKSRGHIQKTVQKYLSPLSSDGVLSFLFLDRSAEMPGATKLQQLFDQLDASAAVRPSSFAFLLLAEILTPLIELLAPVRFVRGLTAILFLALEAIFGFSLAFSRVVFLHFLQMMPLWARRQPQSFRLFVFSYVAVLVCRPFAFLQTSFVVGALSGLAIRAGFYSLRRSSRQSVWAYLARRHAHRTSWWQKAEKWLKRWVGTGLAISLWLQISLFPYFVYLSGQFSLRNIIFQLIIFVTAPLSILVSLLTLLFALIFPPVLLLVNPLLDGFFTVLWRFATWWATLPAWSWSWKLQMWQVIGWWLLLGVSLWLWRQSRSIIIGRK